MQTTATPTTPTLDEPTARLLGSLRHRMIQSVEESATLGHFDRAPSPDDFAALMRDVIGAGEGDCVRAVVDAWVGAVASELSRRVEVAREDEERRAAGEAERFRLMESETTKWEAYEALQGDYAAWKARQSAQVHAD
jgi:hypothetical protein